MKTQVIVLISTAGLLAGCNHWNESDSSRTSNTSGTYSSDSRPGFESNQLPGETYRPGDSTGSGNNSTYRSTQDRMKRNTPDTSRGTTAESNRRDSVYGTNEPSKPATMDSGAVTDGSSDSRILSFLHAKDHEEVELGQLAQTKGGTQAVRDYGQMLERDHRDHDSKVMALAQKAGIDLNNPAPRDKNETDKSDSPDPKARLRDLSGADFDHTFADMMQKAHHKVIDKVEAARATVKDPAVKDLLEQTLPTLRMHESEAAKLRDAAPPRSEQ